MACIRFIGTFDTQSPRQRGQSVGQLLYDENWSVPMASQSLSPVTPERLVGIGFRGWVAGYDYQDISCWEQVWNAYAATLGPGPAKAVITDLASWVRAVRHTTCRRIETYPLGCAGFCRDECIAISVIAASQHNHCPALRACAFALVGTSDIDAMLGEAADFAGKLHAAGQCLSQSMICNVADIAADQAGRDGIKH